MAHMKWNQPLWFILCMNVALVMVWIVEILGRSLPNLKVTVLEF